MKKTHKPFNQVQKLLFDQIESLLPKQIVVAHEISDLLSLSTDAVYRRMRGEKKLNIEEICTLCDHFDISIDDLLQRKMHNVRFETVPFHSDELDNFLSHLLTLGNTLKFYQPEQSHKILYLAGEIPFVHLAAYEELATFKLYTWANSVYNYPGNYNSFCERLKSDKLFQCYREVSAYYQQIPSLEIWNAATFDPTLGWIDFYYETGNIENREMALELCHQLRQFISELQAKVEKSNKNGEPENNFHFYISDVALENNFMIIKSENKRDCFLRLFSASGMIVRNQGYCEETEKWFYNQLDKSTLISGSSKKERHQFFDGLGKKIQNLMDKIESKKTPG